MTSRLERRTFLSRAATASLIAGVMPRNVFGALEGGQARPFAPRAGATDEAVFAAARRELLFPVSIAYCQTGTLGATPREVVEAVIESSRAIEQDLPDWPYRGKPTDIPPMTGYLPIPMFREEVARFLNATVDEVAITQNATMGLSMLAGGLDLERGDEVVTTDQEHGGGLGSWLLRQRRNGVIVKQMALAPAVARGPEAVVALFAEAMTSRTRVAMFSHITSVLGIKLPALDLCRLARDRGVLSVVDGAQAVGQIPVDVRAIGCDAYVASGHKWLVGPKGTGVLYIRRDAQDRFWSILAGDNFDQRSDGAFRFVHFGTGSMPAVRGLVAALHFMTRLGVDRVSRWDSMLTIRLREALSKLPQVRLSSPSDSRFAAAMTTFTVSGHTPNDVQDALWARRIRVRTEGEAGVRFSTHFYVGPTDIDRAVNVIAGLR